MKRISIPSLLTLNASWVGLSFMWNSLHVIVLPAVLLNYVPETQKNTTLGLLTFAGMVIAMLMQPLAGALSDAWASRLGRRRPFIILGTLVDLLFLAFLGWAGGVWMLFFGYIGLQFSSNTSHGAMQGLLPDQVPPEHMGVASGVKNMMDMTGMVVASLVMGNIVSSQNADARPAMLLVIGVIVLTTGITVIFTREKPTASTRQRVDWKALWNQVAHVDIKSNRGYWWLIASRFAFLLGVYGIQTFAQYFVRDRIDPLNPVRTTGTLMAVIVVSLVVFALLAGWLCDRFGRKRVQIAAGVLGAIGSLLMMNAHTPLQVILYGSVLGMGLGIFMTANWAWANDLAPRAEIGKYLGFTNLATAGAGAIGRLEGPLIDALNNAQPGQGLGWSALYVIGAVCIAASTLLLGKIPDRRPGTKAVNSAESDCRPCEQPDLGA